MSTALQFYLPGLLLGVLVEMWILRGRMNAVLTAFVGALFVACVAWTTLIGLQSGIIAMSYGPYEERNYWDISIASFIANILLAAFVPVILFIIRGFGIGRASSRYG